MSDLYTDGTYLYVIQPQVLNYFEDQTYGMECYYRIHVFNADMDEVTEVKLLDPQFLTGESLEYNEKIRLQHLWTSVNYLGDQVYYSYKESVFSCSMEDFLTGEPKFKLVYQKQYKEGEYPYEEN